MLVVIIILLVLDVYFFVGLISALSFFELDQSTIYLMSSIYWSVSAFFLIFFFYYRSKYTLKVAPFAIRMALAIGIGSYISKFIGAIIFLVDDIRIILLSLINFLLTSQLSTVSSLTLDLLGTFFSLGLFLLLIYGIIRNRHRYQLVKIDVPIENLSNDLVGFKIVQISDIHSGSFNRPNQIEPGINLVNSLGADVVFFTGDLVNNVASEIDPYIDIFKKIIAKNGVFSILGNHDYGDYVRWPNKTAKINNLKKLYQAHSLLGWDLLINENRKINVGDSSIAIMGVENISAKGRFSKYGDMDKTVYNLPKADVNILLSHDPSHWDDEIIEKYKFIELTLSGHTHGMQFGIEIANFIKWSPVQYVYKKWAGLYQEGKQYLYVNRGFGYLGYPGRVGILPEITLLTLQRK